MKKLSITVLGIGLLFACTENEEIHIPDTTLLPEHKSTIEIIQKVKDKTQHNYADYFQLAISYAKINEPKEVVEYWLNKAISDNELAVCEYLQFIKQNNLDWEVIKICNDDIAVFLNYCTNLYVDELEESRCVSQQSIKRYRE